MGSFLGQLVLFESLASPTVEAAGLLVRRYQGRGTIAPLTHTVPEGPSQGKTTLGPACRGHSLEL